MLDTLLAAALPHLFEIAGTLLSGVIAWAALQFTRRTGVEIEARHREALHSAIMTGVRAAFLEGKTPGEALAFALNHVSRSTPGAVAALKPAEDVLRRLIESRVAEVFGAAPRQPKE